MRNKNLILTVLFALTGAGLLIYGNSIGYFFLAGAFHYLFKLLFVKPKNLLTLGLILTSVTLMSCGKETLTPTNPKGTVARKASPTINDAHLEVILNSRQYEQLGRPDLTNASLVENKEYPGVYQVLIETRDNEQATFLINDLEAYPIDPLIIIYEPDQDFINANGSVFSPKSKIMFTGTLTVKDLNGEVKEIYNSDGNGQFHPVLGNSVRSCIQYLMSTVEFIVLACVNPWNALGAAATSCLMFDLLGWL